MNIKNRLWILLLPIFLISTITCNSLQKSIVDTNHSHSHHDSIVHIHQHSHSTNTHSHSHSSSSISVLDFFNSLSLSEITSKFNKNDNNFELEQLHSQELINKLLKPPRFS